MTNPTASAADVLATMTPPETCSHASDDHPVWRRLLDYAFTPSSDGKLPFHTVVLGTPKKEGRTMVAAAIAGWALRHLLARGQWLAVFANDRDSVAGGRLWSCIRRSFAGETVSETEDFRRSGLDLPSGAYARVISAIGNLDSEEAEPLITLADDFFTAGQDKRTLWTALSNADSTRVVTSYAGYEGASPLLFDLWRQGEHLDPVPEFDDLRGHIGEPVVRAGDGMLFYWDTVHRAPWMTSEQGQAYLAEQKRVLPPSEYLRLHHNQWCSATEEKP